MELHLCRSEVLEHGNMGSSSQFFSEGFGYFDTASYHYHINVFGRAVQEDVAYVSSYNITFQSQFIGGFGDQFEYFASKVFFQFHIVFMIGLQNYKKKGRFVADEIIKLYFCRTKNVLSI